MVENLLFVGLTHYPGVEEGQTIPFIYYDLKSDGNEKKIFTVYTYTDSDDKREIVSLFRTEYRH